MRTQEWSHKSPANMARIIKTPVKAISRVLDLYVKGVTNFSNAYNKPLRTVEEFGPLSHRLPRSYTISFLADTDQPPEGPLVRSISAPPAMEGKGCNVKLTKFELYMIQRHCHQLRSSASSQAAPRSCGVRMGKIDEDRVASFRYDDIILKSKRCVEDKDSLFLKSHDNDSLLFLG